MQTKYGVFDKSTIVKMKIAILLDSTNSDWYIKDLIEWINKEPNLTLEVLLIQQKNKRTIPILNDKIGNILDRIFFKIINIIEKRIIFSKYQKYKNHFKNYDLKKFNIKEVHLNNELTSNNKGTFFSKNDIKKVKDFNLDLIIRGGSNILKGDILNSSKFGVISFHHGDNIINRGGPAGFWEVYEKNPKTGFTIQILDENLDGGKVLKRGNFVTEQFYTLNQILLKRRSNNYLKELINQIYFLKKLPDFQNYFPYYKKFYKSPNFLISIKYLISRIFEKIKIIILTRISHDVWHVGFQKEKAKKIAFYKSNIITNPKNSFLADPFVVEHKNKDYIFLEEYNFSKKKGIISVYENKNNIFKRIGIALEENFHLSFPFIFMYENKFYMMPETKESNEIRIYESDNFPMEWKLKKTIMKSIKAADSMIFEFNNYWWLITTFSNTEHNTDSELQVFYSLNGPLTDNWIGFKNNPVIIDPDLGRNAGIFFDNNKIYRASQSYGFNSYGKKINVNEIIKLAPDIYEEKKYSTIEPEFFKNIKGIHHIHSNNKFTVFDYCKREFKKFF